MPKYPTSIEKLIETFMQLPGVGRKTAERYAFYVLKRSPQLLNTFVEDFQTVKSTIKTCEQCFNYSTERLCDICRDSQRNQNIICVVPESSTVSAIEQTDSYSGVYHVLGGVVNQLEGVGPNHLRLTQLIKRAQQPNVEEIILAMNPDVAGEATSLYITKALQPISHITISRLARGLPAGSDIEYADDITLGDALLDRKTI